MNKPKLIGLCGLARSGKDTFFSLAREYLFDYNIYCQRFSFADALKYDVKDFLLEKVGISPFTEDNVQKEIIRDFLVAYGTKLMRRMHEDHWINKIKEGVEQSIINGCCPIITDIRYLNELDWISNLGGISIHIERVGNEPPNQDEAINDPLLKARCNYSLRWDDFQNSYPKYKFDIIKQTIEDVLNPKRYKFV